MAKTHKPNMLFYHQSETTLGTMTVVATVRGIRGLIFTDNAKKGMAEAALEPLTDPKGEIRKWVRALEVYLGGKGALPKLPLDSSGTAFQKAVWKKICTIPIGKTMTYSEVAKALGKPAAVRAVAGTCAANRIALLIPCHRVRRTDGAPGGFRWGLARKQALLEREQA